MAEKGGKHLLLKVEIASVYTTLGGLRSKSMSVENQEIDVTNHDSNEWATKLSGAGIKSVKISGSGVHNGGASVNYVDDLAFSGALNNFQIVDTDSGRTYQGSFKVVSFERSGNFDKEQPYSISLMSSGAVTVS